MLDLERFEADEALWAVEQSGEAFTGLYPPEIEPSGAKNGDLLVARLNERFRIVAEGGADPRQWMLQRSKVVKGVEAWSPISFCQTRDGLLLSIREKCIDASVAYRRSHPGEVIRADYPGMDAEAMTIIKGLPDRFPRRVAQMEKDADVDSE